MDDKPQEGVLFSQPAASMELYLQRLHNNLDGVETQPESMGDIVQERMRLLEAEEPRVAPPETGAELVDRGQVIELYRSTMDALHHADNEEHTDEEDHTDNIEKEPE